MKNLFRTLILFTTPIPAFAQGEFLQRVSENFEAHTPSGYVKKICQITERGTLITLKNENGKILSTDGRV